MTLIVPLHVRVAMALGCMPIHVDWSSKTEWVCTCDELDHSDSDNLPHVMSYDTDWRAGGPLIAGFDLDVGPVRWRGDTAIRWMAARKGAKAAIERKGDSPLAAICNLVLALHDAGKLPLLP